MKIEANTIEMLFVHKLKLRPVLLALTEIYYNASKPTGYRKIN